MWSIPRRNIGKETSEPLVKIVGKLDTKQKHSFSGDVKFIFLSSLILKVGDRAIIFKTLYYDLLYNFNFVL